MATKDCIETLVRTDWIDQEVSEGEGNSAEEWRRISERKGHDGDSFVRVFEHVPSRKKFYFVTNRDDNTQEDYLIYPAGQWFYTTCQRNGQTFLHFNAKSWWEEHSAPWDRHVSDFLRKVFGISLQEYGAREEKENTILLNGETTQSFIPKLEEAGFRRYAQFDNYMMA